MLRGVVGMVCLVVVLIFSVLMLYGSYRLFWRGKEAIDRFIGGG